MKYESTISSTNMLKFIRIGRIILPTSAIKMIEIMDDSMKDHVKVYVATIDDEAYSGYDMSRDTLEKLLRLED